LNSCWSRGGRSARGAARTVAYTKGSNANTGSPVSRRFRVCGGKLRRNFRLRRTATGCGALPVDTGKLYSSTTIDGPEGRPVCRRGCANFERNVERNFVVAWCTFFRRLSASSGVMRERSNARVIALVCMREGCGACGWCVSAWSSLGCGCVGGCGAGSCVRRCAAALDG